MMSGKVAVGVSLLALAASTALFAQNSSNSKVERGKYLVEQVGMCADCHTPFSEKGEPVMEKHLQGAVLMFKPTVPIPGWAEKSANIAGLKGWSDAEAMKFLTTGVDPNGKMAGPPMPRYRFNDEDAAAILAYLRTFDKAATTASK